MELIAIPVYLIAGFLFGTLTCSPRVGKSRGLTLTIGMLTVLNFLHSLVDGITLHTIPEAYRSLALVLHELLRQSLMYFFLWKILKDFLPSVHARTAFLFCCITTVWIAGTLIGVALGRQLHALGSCDELLSTSIFLFVGDFIHHVVEGRHALKQNNKSVTP